MSAGMVALIAVLTVSPCAAESGPAKRSKMDPPGDYPHAGVGLTLPPQFQPQTLRDPLDVVRAVGPADANGDIAPIALTLSAFPVDAKVTPEAFADAMLAELKRRGEIRKLKILNKAPIKVAGLDGTAYRLSYAFRGVKTVSVWLHFVQASKAPLARICYFLSLDAPAERRAQLQPIFTALVAGVRLIPLQRPSDKTMGALGAELTYESYGFSFRPPHSWYVGHTAQRHTGVMAVDGRLLLTKTVLHLGQTDYLSGGRRGVRSSLVLGSVPRGIDVQTYARQSLRALVSPSEQASPTAEAPAKLAGVTGHQYVCRPRPLRSPDPRTPADDAPGQSAFLVIRSIVVPSQTGPARGFSLLLRCRAADANAAAAMMDRLASGFRLPTPTTRPAAEATTGRQAFPPRDESCKIPP